MRPLEREPLPAQAYIALDVVHGAGVSLRAVGVCRAEELRIAAGVVVIDGTKVETEITERFLPATIEIHLDVAARVAGPLADVGIPVAEINAALVAIVEAALDRRLAIGLIDPAEPVLRNQGHVAGDGRRRRRGGSLLGDGGRRC